MGRVGIKGMIIFSLVCVLLLTIAGLYLKLQPSTTGELWQQVIAPNNPPIDFPFQGGELRIISGKGLDKPLGVAVTADGRVLVADSGNNRVVMFDITGKVLRQYGQSSIEGAAMNYPVAVAVDDSQQLLYVADFNNGRVQVWHLEGEYLYQLPVEKDGKELGTIKPAALAVGDSGKLYVSDVLGQRVLVFDASGRLFHQFGEEGAAAGQFKFANGIAVDEQNDRIYVADTNNGRIQEFSLSGEYKRSLKFINERKLVTPRGLALDRQRGLLHIADTITHRIASYDLAAAKGLLWGSEGSEKSRFNFPNGLAADQSGNLYIADRDNNRVMVYIHLDQ